MSRIGKKPVPVPAGRRPSTVRRQRRHGQGPARASSSRALDGGVDGAGRGRQLVTLDARGRRASSDRALPRPVPRARSRTWSTASRRASRSTSRSGRRLQRQRSRARSSTLNIGFSNPVVLEIPTGITVETPKPTQIVITGADKQLVGQFAAERAHDPPARALQGQGHPLRGRESSARPARPSSSGEK